MATLSQSVGHSELAGQPLLNSLSSFGQSICYALARDGHAGASASGTAVSAVVGELTVTCFLVVHVQTGTTEGGSALSEVTEHRSEVESIRVEYKSILEIKNLEPYTVRQWHEYRSPPRDG